MSVAAERSVSKMPRMMTGREVKSWIGLVEIERVLGGDDHLTVLNMLRLHDSYKLVPV